VYTRGGGWLEEGAGIFSVAEVAGPLGEAGARLTPLSSAIWRCELMRVARMDEERGTATS
jgi:hypothetical protein